MLTDKIQQDQIAALKAHEAEKLSVLRFLLSDIKNEQIAKQKDLSDEDVVPIIRKQIKKLSEAATMFESGGRPELVEENKRQMAILSAYLPAEITDEELQKKISAIIEEHRQLYESNRSAVIGILMGKLKSETSPSRIMSVFNSL